MIFPELHWGKLYACRLYQADSPKNDSNFSKAALVCWRSHIRWDHYAWSHRSVLCIHVVSRKTDRTSSKVCTFRFLSAWSTTEGIHPDLHSICITKSKNPIRMEEWDWKRSRCVSRGSVEIIPSPRGTVLYDEICAGHGHIWLSFECYRNPLFAVYIPLRVLSIRM